MSYSAVSRVRWVVLVPMKALPGAKSRLAGAADDHARLVDAIRRDTLAAVAAAAPVAAVVAVVDTADTAVPVVDLLERAEAFVQTVPGLNGGLAEAAAWAGTRWPEHGVAALVGDLPALRPEQLSTALTAASAHPRGFVADADGTGTTLLTALPGVRLEPRYGPQSAERHGAEAARLPAGPGLRTDVDTADDLRAALRLGVGPATAELMLSQDTARSPVGDPADS